MCIYIYIHIAHNINIIYIYIIYIICILFLHTHTHTYIYIHHCTKEPANTWLSCVCLLSKLLVPQWQVVKIYDHIKPLGCVFFLFLQGRIHCQICDRRGSAMAQGSHVMCDPRTEPVEHEHHFNCTLDVLDVRWIPGRSETPKKWVWYGLFESWGISTSKLGT